DWDRALDAREAIFRDDLYQCLTAQDSSRFFATPGGIKLRKDGRVVTDIDAVIYDRTTGDLALFQLKWQDAFGASLSKRSSGAKNFTAGAQQWVDTVSQWLLMKEDHEIRGHFGLKERTAPPLKVRLFVLGRFAAHFSDYGRPDVRAAWGIWP